MSSFSANKSLTVPTVGSDTGTWGGGNNTTINGVDGILGGTLTLGLTNANVTLTNPNAPTAGAGPTQAQNAILRFTGNLTGNCQITCALPGFYIAHNTCTGNFVVTLVSGVGGGKAIGLPPGKMQQVASDGTDFFFVNMPDPGSFWDYAGSTAPLWIAACTVPPWLVCNGQSVSQATYAPLFAAISTSYGNPGGGNFNVPDLQNRMRVPIMATSPRVASGRSGIDGTTLNSSNTIGASGNTLFDVQTLAAGQIPQMTTGTESATHAHTFTANTATNTATQPGGGNRLDPTSGTVTTSTENATHTHTVGSASPSNVPIMPPALVTGLVFIKT